MSMFTAVEMAPRDPILGLNEQFAADTNPNKVNLGVGVYFDDNGKNLVNQHVRFIESGEKDPLMTHEKALITQSRGREVPELD